MISPWLAMLVLTTTPSVDVITLQNEFSGNVQQISADGIQLETDTDTQEIAWRDLLQLDFDRTARPPSAGAEVRLTDETTLKSSSLSIADSVLSCQLADSLTAKVPVKGVRSILFGELNETLTPQWQSILQSKPTTDLLVIQKGETLDYLEGIIGKMDETTIEFTLEGDEIPVPKDRVFALVYFQNIAPSKPPTILGYLQDTAGNQFTLAKVSWKPSTPDSLLSLETIAGMRVSVPLETVVRIRGSVEYLSDFEPLNVKVEHPVPLPYTQWEPQRDRHFYGGPLQIGETVYRKGLSLHSRTKIEYYLGGKYRKLLGFAGIDQAASDSLGNVRLVIRGDNRILLEAELLVSDPQPVELDLNLAKVQRLEILVDYGEGNDTGDHVCLGNLRLIK
ncbi:Hypothetical protein PBC10988_36250 [Planctomycetales bacterium 10988]|nr:Hypothetical protein PBC10988_36250 [Planctomycetales bacterium 10988]